MPCKLPASPRVSVSRRQSAVPAICFHRSGPGAFPPPDGPPGEKQKRRAGQTLHSARSERFSCGHEEYNGKTHPLRQGPDCRIISPCGAAIGRCVGGLGTCAGLRVLVTPAGCRIFVFQVDYSRIFPAMQDLLAPGRHLTNRSSNDKIFPLPQRERERCTADRRLATSSERR